MNLRSGSIPRTSDERFIVLLIIRLHELVSSLYKYLSSDWDNTNQFDSINYD